MFNLQGSEIIFILLIALVVLGPEKLPGAIRRVTSLYAELRKLSSGFQEEFKSVLDEPLREMKSTADLMKNAADPKRIAEEAGREADMEAAAAKKAKQASDNTAAMKAAGAAHLAQASAEPTAEVEPPLDAFADPFDDTEGVAEADDAENAGDDADLGSGHVDDESAIDEVPSIDETTPVPRLASVDLADTDHGIADVPDGEPGEKSA